MIHGGAIGDIVAMQSMFLRGPYRTIPRTPGLTETQYQFRNWYHFRWLSGDDVTQSLVHNVDRMSWVMQGEMPTWCFGLGGRSSSFGEIYGDMFDPHGVVYETRLTGAEVVAFYQHHMKQHAPTVMTNGLQFTDPKSPITMVTLSTSALGRMLILTPNAMVMDAERASAGDTLFGVPIMPGASQVAETSISGIYAVEKPVEEVMAWYREAVPALPGMLRLDNVNADEPSLLIQAHNLDVPWEMVNVSRDTSVLDREVTRIIITRKR